MSEGQDEEERPCLHCMIVELIDQFFEEYPAATGDGSDTIDTDELITAIAKTGADLTCGQNGTMRQQIMEKGPGGSSVLAPLQRNAPILLLADLSQKSVACFFGQ